MKGLLSTIVGRVTSINRLAFYIEKAGLSTGLANLDKEMALCYSVHLLMKPGYKYEY